MLCRAVAPKMRKVLHAVSVHTVWTHLYTPATRRDAGLGDVHVSLRRGLRAKAARKAQQDILAFLANYTTHRDVPNIFLAQ